MKPLRNYRLWRLVLIALVVPLAVVAFWPSPVDEPIQGLVARILQFLHRRGLPTWFNYKFIEASANVALFTPVGFVISLAFPDARWWRIGVLGLMISGCIEISQFLFLHNRFASPFDLVTNASGGVIGALLAAWGTQKTRGPSPCGSGPLESQ